MPESWRLSTMLEIADDPAISTVWLRHISDAD